MSRFTAGQTESACHSRYVRSDCSMPETEVSAFQNDVRLTVSAIMKGELGSTHIKCSAALVTCEPVLSHIVEVMNHYHSVEPVGAMWSEASWIMLCVKKASNSPASSAASDTGSHDHPTKQPSLRASSPTQRNTLYRHTWTFCSEMSPLSANLRSSINVTVQGWPQRGSLHFVNTTMCQLNVPCIVWLGVTGQHCALIIIPLSDTQAPTCFGIHVSSSGSLCRYELMEGRIIYF
jgi:hypothetical protein